MEVLKVKKLSPKAQLPTKTYDEDLGFDLYLLEPMCLEPSYEPLTGNAVTLLPTGIAICPPKGYGAILKDRSGLATKKGLHILAGVIDPLYRGEIKVPMVNLSTTFCTLLEGERIAQLILVPLVQAQIMPVSTLDETERGEKGFGSSGRF